MAVLWCGVLGLKERKRKKLQSTEMRMLCRICEKTLKDGISIEANCNITGIKTEEFLIGQRLQWFGHVESMDDDDDLK